MPAADRGGQIEIFLPAVRAIHQFENTVIAGPQRQMNVFADVRMAGHGIQQGWGKSLGWGR